MSSSFIIRESLPLNHFTGNLQSAGQNTGIIPISRLLKACLAACLLVCGLRESVAETPAKSGWELLVNLKIDEAGGAFRGGAKSRETRLGEAVVLLNSQPRSQANVAAAGRILEEIVAGGEEDRVATQAAYQLARIAHVHLSNPDYPLAASRYEELIRKHPGDPLADAAVVKLAILRLYSLPQENEYAARFAALDRMGGALRDPDAIRDYNLVVADALARWDLDPQATLDHLQKAYATGRLSGKLESDVLVRISETASGLGNAPLSHDFARRFLDKFPRDERASTIRKTLETDS